MKKIFFFYLYILPVLTMGQHHLDENWLVGCESWAGSPWGITQMNFSNDSLAISWHDMPINFDRTASIISSEQTGEILFSTNGFTILDRNADTMQNAFWFSPCPYSTSYADEGVTFSQGALVLPFPEHPNQYYMFHEPLTLNLGVGAIFAPKLLYSFIDLTANNGLGKVVNKNTTVVVDSLTEGLLTACKHANGRDYWIVAPRYSGDGYHIFLLTPNGIEHKGYHSIGTRRISCGGASSAVFSPDATKYVRNDTYLADRVTIMDFDRCSGSFSNVLHVNVPNGSSGGGVAISPNSRWLYWCSDTAMYQIDLTANDIWGSKAFLDRYDGYQSPFGSYFYQGQLAPDGKIYWNCTNGENVMHVIDHPDSAGVACGFRQHAIQLLSYNSFTMPHYPNYYLGAMAGSGCDTITTATNQLIQIATIYAYPNPSKDKVFIGGNHLQNDVTLLLVNSLGQEIYHQAWQNTQVETSISMAHFPQGIYYLRVLAGGNIFTEKIIKQ